MLTHQATGQSDSCREISMHTSGTLSKNFSDIAGNTAVAELLSLACGVLTPTFHQIISHLAYIAQTGCMILKE